MKHHNGWRCSFVLSPVFVEINVLAIPFKKAMKGVFLTLISAFGGPPAPPPPAP